MRPRNIGRRWPSRPFWRGSLVLAVVLLLHAVAIVGVRREIALAEPTEPTQTTLSIALLKAPQPPAVESAPTRPKPPPTPRTPSLPAPSAQPAAVAPEPAPPPPPPPPPAPAEEPAAPPPAATEPEAPPSTLPPGVKQLPTKGRIAYRTTYTRMRGIEALTYVDWSIDLEQGRYELWLRTVDPPGLLDLRSTGELRPFGIAPFRYVERVDIANRELSVDFDWTDHMVRFAGRGAGEPSKFEDGTQDPLSLQFHLPLLAQTYPWRFTPGSQIDFQVARRKVESYSFVIDGFEPITLGGKSVQTLKVLRPKTPDSNRAVEMWMAPEFDWIPVRLRYIDPNGETWDSVLAHLPGGEPPLPTSEQEVVKP
jgi:Protein of unknown function (DUF3108)